MTAHQDARPDNLFGVCNALGEDFGFNPLWLRLSLAVVFLFAPVAVTAGYFAVGAAVWVARRLFPNPHRAPRQPTRPWIVPATPAAAANEPAALELSRAA